MDRIETDTSMHALEERLDDLADADGKRRGRTWCGRTVRGRTGHADPRMITCRPCLHAMRKRGWTVRGWMVR